MLDERSMRTSADKAEDIWTTDSVPEPEREAYWRAALRHLYPDLTEVEPLDGEAAFGRLVIRDFADGRASECQHSAARLAGAGRDPALDGWDGYNLTLQIYGVGRLCHAGRTFHRRFGELTLTDAALPFEEVGLGNPHVQVWSLPRRVLEPLLVAPDLSIGLGIDSRQGAGALLLSLLQTTWRECGRLARPMQHRIQESICRLVALAFSPAAVARTSGHNGPASLPEACAFIESRLQDPRLSVDEVAGWLHLSRRKLEMLFAEAGIGVAGWIGRRRVEECRKMLADPAWRHLSITEVAFTWGFRDLSTFNRRFRAQFGMAPREVRRELPAAGQELEQVPAVLTIAPFRSRTPPVGE